MSNDLNVYSLKEIENLKVHGRTTGELTPLTLFWTGSGIELNVSGKELWIEVEVDYDQYEPWIYIVMNSYPISRMMLTKGRYWLCVFRGMNPNVVKNIRIVKELQAMSGDDHSCLQIHSIKSDGMFKPIEEKPIKIEFIGDSITSGEGAVGAKTEEDWIPMWFSAVHNYSNMTSVALNAEYRVISQSGWGVLTSWDNNPYANIPDYYEKVCGIVNGEKNQSLGACRQNDFEAWQPDVVVVNLGTNDGGAFYSPEWKGNGKTHKQRLNEDGSFNEDDLKVFEEAVLKFLVKLRKYNKKAHLVWAYGMLGTPMMPSIKRAVEAYIEQTSDRKVSVIELPNTSNETVGARNHPGLLDHKNAANKLSEYIKSII